MRYTDRIDAGQRLAKRLERLRGEDVVVLGLPRGGVPVAYEVATALQAPLDVIMVRKLGVPYQPELAMGAIGEGGVKVTNDDVIDRAGITDQEIAMVEERERLDLDRQAQQFRAGRSGVPLAGRTAIVIDDGIATGSTASVACEVARRRGAAKVVLAAPVGAPESIAMLRTTCDDVVCLQAPPFFMAVGTWYDDFGSVPDAEVIRLLERAAADPEETRPAGLTRPSTDSTPPERDDLVEIPAGGVTLSGHLVIPPHARGVVIFVHGSGSSRHSPRNRRVADELNESGLGTLLFDLLTGDEESNRANVFDIPALAGRLIDVTAWLAEQPGVADTGLGYFGASTGAAAALWAAAEPRSPIGAVVSRGGRPDLAGERLQAVGAPTLLIVGDRDPIVLELNRQAQRQLRCENHLAIVPGATHLFEEPGALQTVTRLARDWFTEHMGLCLTLS